MHKELCIFLDTPFTENSRPAYCHSYEQMEIAPRESRITGICACWRKNDYVLHFFVGRKSKEMHDDFEGRKSQKRKK